MEELHALIEGLRHIKSVVQMQQNFAKQSSNVLENVSVKALVDESAKLSEASLTRHGIELACDLTGDETVYADRHKTMQILVNLMSNAKDAINAHKPPRGRIVISTRKCEDSLVIRVTDNGSGIGREDLERIFRYGFTTKPTGHGFGLHSSATAAIEMGGHLKAMSDGPGCGATFELDLPMQPRTTNAVEHTSSRAIKEAESVSSAPT
jgi:hypothetical protein